MLTRDLRASQSFIDRTSHASIYFQDTEHHHTGQYSFPFVSDIAIFVLQKVR